MKGGQPMKPDDPPTLPTRLAALRRRFEQWRAGKPTASSRIPQGLWTAAVRCAKQHGLYLTVRTLGLDFNSLKRRVKAAAAVPAPARVVPAFVELVSPRRDSQPECVLELENRRGAKLRLEVRGSAVPDLVELVRRFGRDEP
jgi:hypothetical protein